MTEASKLFTKLQMMQSGKQERGRRFSIDEKILALSVYKHSPRTYRFLSKLFTLPSRRTLLKLLQQLHLDCGVNDVLFNSLKKSVQKLRTVDRYCVLMFDEMSLMPHLKYEESKKRILGFEDFGDGERNLKIADHALVFMVRGIRRKFKQPVCFTFCENATSTPNLCRLLKKVVKAVTDANLKIVATVCDQGGTNNAAINHLQGETRGNYLRAGREWKGCMEIYGQKIVSLFDPPHLMKGIRNNLLTKNLIFVINGKKMTAKWEHVVRLYEYDKGKDESRLLPKLTDLHIIPGKIRKMKVKYCTQVFSQKVHAVMKLCAGMYFY